jgi:phosphoribosylformimino-5-aminoimidazole carboxamide ribotide isomerase
MIVIPAIDLFEGKVVRLIQGDFRRFKIYSENPENVAKKFKEEGAKFLHVIDLEGAKQGRIKNIKSIEKILKEGEISVQVGGGIREIEDIEILLGIGIKRVIIGTRVLQEDFLKKVIDLFGDKIVVSLDVKEGKIAIEGWQKITSISAFEFIKKLENIGVKRIIYTDIKRDGTLSGCNIEGVKNIVENVSIPVIASGGISSLQEIKELKKIKLEGVIVGKAIYEGKFSLRKAIEEAKNENSL